VKNPIDINYEALEKAIEAVANGPINRADIDAGCESGNPSLRLKALVYNCGEKVIRIDIKRP
jgi:hypothetical protein